MSRRLLMPMRPIHRYFYAEGLLRQRRASQRRRQVASQRSGRVDPNPHQIDAVVFALRRMTEAGCILAAHEVLAGIYRRLDRDGVYQDES